MKFEAMIGENKLIHFSGVEMGQACTIVLRGASFHVLDAAGYFSEVKGSNKRKYFETTKLTEISVSDKLEEFCSEKYYFKGLSFPTISSVGPNAAIIHYSPNRETCAELQPDSIYLCDSQG